MSLASRYILSILLSLAILIPACWHYAGASTQCSAAATRFNRVHTHAAKLTSARSSLPDWAARAITPGHKQASDALAPRVSAALASCGLSPATLANLSVQSNAEGPVIAGSLRIHRSRATLVLAQVPLPRLGAFLQTWRAAEPDWRPTAIDAAPEPQARADKPPAPGSDLPLHIVLSLESLSIQPVATTSPAGVLR